MKRNLIWQLCSAISLLTQLQASCQSTYPKWQGPKASVEMYKSVEEGLPQFAASIDPPFEGSPTAAETLEGVKGILQSLGTDSLVQTWIVVNPVGRMPLPAVCIGTEFWVAQAHFLPFNERESNLKATAYQEYWKYEMNGLARDLFAVMAASSSRSEVRISDILRLHSVLGYQVKSEAIRVPFKPLPNKSDWQALFNSPNPCYKLIAFEVYDRMPLTAQEKLAVYQAGLTNSCSYVELRVFYGIFSAKDYRPEVKALVQQYLATNPIRDDGTLIYTLSYQDFPFANSVDAAQKILEEMP